MKIVIDGRMILPQMTGVGRYLLGLLGALGELDDLPGAPHFEAWLQKDLPLQHPAWKLAGPRMEVRALPAAHMSLAAQWRLPAELLRTHPDLLHCPHFDLPWLTPGCIVATIHDLKYLARPDFFPQMGQAKRLVMLAMMRFTARRSRLLITDAEFTRQDMTRRLGVSLDKTRSIPLGIQPGYFVKASPEEIENLRRRYSLGGPFLLFVGERRPHKNIEGLLRAFSLFQRMQPAHNFSPAAYRLVIAGKRYADYQAPEQLAEKLGLGEQVRFIDYVPEADLPLLYRAAEAFVLLSRYEGFGLPVLEAMACGTPVVAADCTSLPEVCGDAGLLVSPDDPEQAALALQQVTAGGARREACIAAGLERAARFTWTACARQTFRVYQEALQ
jgi:glycosyltransferase involved in cell wall biosynthesis